MINTPGYWENPDTTKTLEEFIGHRNLSQNKLHVEEVNKKDLEIKVGLNIYQLSDSEDYSKRKGSLKLQKL